MTWWSKLLKPAKAEEKLKASVKERLESIDDGEDFLKDIPKSMELIKENAYLPVAMSSYSILDALSSLDEERTRVQMKLMNNEFDPEEDRAIGIFLSNVIGDALGAPLEFSDVRYEPEPELKGFDQKEVWERFGYNRFRLRPGQWTDDFSMAQCIADSLLIHKTLNLLDIRARFCCWWYLGYCNAFGFTSGDKRRSVGLGGNISFSLSEFLDQPTHPLTESGDQSTSGNGSVMRNSPVVVFFYKKGLEAAMEAAHNQSKTTHQGDEASELCRLLTFVCFKGIQSGDKNKVFDCLENEFTSRLYTVTCLSKGKNEEKHEENKNLPLKDRKWNWKEPNYRFCEARTASNPGYIGSYAMDAVAMALHCVYHTDNYTDAVLKCVNLRGDSDSHGAVCAQIAGSIYGCSSIPKDWICTVQNWDRGGDIALKAYKLYHTSEVNQL